MTESTPSNKILTKEQLERCQMWQMPDVSTGQSPTKRAALFTNEVESIRQQAYNEGQKRGAEEAFAQKEAELNAKIEQLKQMIELFKQPEAVFSQAIEQQVLTIIEVIVQKVLQQELSINPSAIATVYDALRKELPILHESIEIYFHPDDYETLKALLAEHQVPENEKISALDSLSRGEAILKSQYTTLDATVKGRLTAVAEKMLSDNPASGDPASE